MPRGTCQGEGRVECTTRARRESRRDADRVQGPGSSNRWVPHPSRQFAKGGGRNYARRARPFFFLAPRRPDDCVRRHSHGVFLFVSALSFLHHTADMVRHNPAVSAGGKSAWGHTKSQYSGIWSLILSGSMPCAGVGRQSPHGRWPERVECDSIGRPASTSTSPYMSELLVSILTPPTGKQWRFVRRLSAQRAVRHFERPRFGRMCPRSA